MRPIHVVVLLLGGAVGGALIMKVMHPGQPLIPVADAVEVQPVVAFAPEQPAPAEPEPEATPPIMAVVTKPSPKPRAVPKAQPVRPLAPVLAVVLHSPAPQPQIAEPEPIVAPPPASPEPEQVTPVAPQASAAPVPQPHQVTLNAGLFLPVRLVDGLSSERNAPGDSFAATLDKEVVADGFVIAERGARVEGRVVAVDRAKARSSAALALELTTLHTSDGQTVAIRTDGYFKHADPPQVNNTTKIAGGAILGAGDVLLTRRPAELPSESLVTFRLKIPVPLTEQLR